jgi:hypothetical protein
MPQPGKEKASFTTKVEAFDENKMKMQIKNIL